MLIVVSPAKNLDIESNIPVSDYSQPQLLDDSQILAEQCKTLSPAELGSLMSISDKLAILNAQRFNDFSLPFTQQNARQAMYMFNGDVYAGLDAHSLTADDVAFSQQHLRILSGLYGILKPLDLMQAYRLEMGTKLANERGKNLYEFWQDKIAQAINSDLADDEAPVLVNLASNEYFKAIDKKVLQARVITPVFKDYKNGQYKIISFFAKKARGVMARYLIQEQVTDPEQIKQFNLSGYVFSVEQSKGDNWVFLRDAQEV